MPPFFFGYAMSFSGQPFYEQILYQFYNVMFTCFPIMVYALLDRSKFDLTDREQAYAAYIPGRHRSHFNYRVFVVWMFTGMMQAGLITQIAFLILGDGYVAAGMTSGDLWSLGAVVYFWVILCANITMYPRMNKVFTFSIVASVTSVLLHPACVFATDRLLGSPFLRGVFSFMYGCGFWRLAVATLLAVIAHMCIGEPLLQLAAFTNFSGTKDCYGYAPIFQSDSLLSEVKTVTDLPPDASRQSLAKAVSSYTGSACSNDCNYQRNRDRTFGRRNSLNAFDDGKSDQERIDSGNSLSQPPTNSGNSLSSSLSAPREWIHASARRSVDNLGEVA